MKSEYISALVTQALANVMSDQTSMEYYERRLRRNFSETFHTSFLDTYKIPFDEILLNVFEHRFEQMKVSPIEEQEDQLWHEVNVAVNPNYDVDKEKENEDFARKIAERERLKKNDPANLEAATAQMRAFNKQHNPKYKDPEGAKVLKSMEQPQSMGATPLVAPTNGGSRQFADEIPPELK